MFTLIRKILTKFITPKCKTCEHSEDASTCDCRRLVKEGRVYQCEFWDYCMYANDYCSYYRKKVNKK